MDNMDKRKFRRYDTFLQLTLSVPDSQTNNAFETTGWTKNVSQGGVGLELFILSSDKIDRLVEIVTNKQLITVLIPLDNSSIEVKCKIVWGTFSENKMPYLIGLQIVESELRQSNRWEGFVEGLAQH